MNQSSMDVQGFTDYQDALNQLSQLKKIIIISYFDEPEKHDGSRMLYRSHVSLKHIQTGQTLTGSSVYVESRDKAKEQAAQDAWCQIQQARSFQIQEGRGELSNIIVFSFLLYGIFTYRQFKIISDYISFKFLSECYHQANL